MGTQQDSASPHRICGRSSACCIGQSPPRKLAPLPTKDDTHDTSDRLLVGLFGTLAEHQRCGDVSPGAHKRLSNICRTSGAEIGV